MGTKATPGKFDCYAKAAPDEPIFTLRAKDPSAPYLILAWAAMRNGKIDDVLNAIQAMTMNKEVMLLIEREGYDKLKEARDVAMDMIAWRKENIK